MAPSIDVTFNAEMFGTWKQLDPQAQMDFIHRYLSSKYKLSAIGQIHNKATTQLKEPSAVYVTFADEHVFVTSFHPKVTKMILQQLTYSNGIMLKDVKTIEETDSKHTIIASILGRWLPIHFN